MFRPRIIPVLQLKGKSLVKTVKFGNPAYLGDPLNAVKLFNEKLVDELVFVDIFATRNEKCISLDLIEMLSDECNMPFGVGGGIKELSIAKNVIKSGAEKVIINTEAILNPDIITSISGTLGSQSIAVSLDIKKNFFGKYEVYIKSGTINTKKEPLEVALLCQEKGAGEILLNSIDRDGTFDGYDINIIKKVSENIDIPTIALGGAANYSDLLNPYKFGKANAVAAGSIFVYHGKHNAVLINYPENKYLENLFIKI